MFCNTARRDAEGSVQLQVKLVHRLKRRRQHGGSSRAGAQSFQGHQQSEPSCLVVLSHLQLFQQRRLHGAGGSAAS